MEGWGRAGRDGGGCGDGRIADRGGGGGGGEGRGGEGRERDREAKEGRSTRGNVISEIDARVSDRYS